MTNRLLPSLWCRLHQCLYGAHANRVPQIVKQETQLVTTQDFIFVKRDLFPDLAIQHFGKNTGQIYVASMHRCNANEHHYVKITHPNRFYVLKKLELLQLHKQKNSLTKHFICVNYNKLR